MQLRLATEQALNAALPKFRCKSHKGAKEGTFPVTRTTELLSGPLRRITPQERD